MKNLTKIFMAVVAGMFAFSCVTDTTNDLAPEVNVNGGNGQHALTLSLEKSRTLLGEKGTDGVYPVSWCEDDAIAVNGVASTGIEIKADGKTATFTFGDSVISRPFNIVYPAPAAEVEDSATTGLYPITLLAEQPYTEGSFCDGAAVMYGYATADDAFIKMHHLTGVLRVAPYGEGVVLKRITFKAQLGKIAGTFDVNCVTGELSPRAEASNTITVDLGDNFALAATAEEATPIYAAVPAGEYGMFTVVFETENDSMTLKFDSNGEKAIKASVVREFGAFPYLANEGGNDEFLIESKEDLFEFAKIAANFAPYTSAKLAATIDMTGEEWTPIEGFAHSFDGNKGEGCYIKGLNAPLFGETSATIFDLDLQDVNIVSNGRLVLGAVACNLAENGKLLNSHTSGNITVSNPDTTIESGANKYNTVNIAGVVGTSYGDVKNCVNEANITVNQVASSDNTVVIHPCVGGVVGYSLGGGVTNCVNGNEAKTTGAIKYLDNQAAQIYTPHVAGIAGMGVNTNVSPFKGNTNYGAIEFNANGAGTGELDSNSTSVAGVIAQSCHAIENNNNYGTITISGGKIKAFVVGGVIGTSKPAKLINCHNHQGANITVDSDVTFWGISVAGVVASYQNSSEALDNCTNDAPIHVKASSDANATAGSQFYYRVGGVITYSNYSVHNCENKANGDITVEGNVTLLRSNNQPGYAVVGVSCYHTTDGTAVNLINRGDINVYTNVTPFASWNTTKAHQTYGKIDIAGISGYDTKAKRDFQNYGNITIGKTDSAISITGNGIHIGGLASYFSNTISVTNLAKNINAGKITINKVTFNGKFSPTAEDTDNTWSTHIGGIAGYPTGAISKSENSGAITVGSGATFSSETSIGGAVGYTTSTISTSENSGAITTNGTYSSNLYAGGVVGHTTATELSGVKNNVGGAMTIGGTINGQSYIGGITGTYAGALTSCENHGTILFNGTCASNKHFYIAGITGYSTSTAITSCTNTGDITIDKCSVASTSSTEYTVCLSGIVGYQATNVATFKNCSNSGTLQITKNVSSNFVTKVGGIIGGTNKSIALDNCHNSMKANAEYGIILKHTTTTGAGGSNQARAGGVIGWQNSGTLTTKNGVSNSAGCYFGCINKDTGGSSYGGIAGVLGGNAHSFGGTISNSGNLHYAGASHAGTFSIGGLFGQSGNKAPSLCEDLQNTGNITVEKTNNNWKPTAKKHGYIGGVIGIHSVALSNAQSVCTITAIGFEDTHTVSSTDYFNTVGGIVGTTSSANLTNCHCGGEFLNGYDSEGQTYSGITFDETNYYQHLSGDHTFTSAAAKAQGCGYISSIDATPEYAE